MATIQIHCNNCQYKLFTDGTPNLVEIKKANPPARADGKHSETFNRGKFFRCPQCGYTMKCFMPPPEKPIQQDQPTTNRPKDMDERINGDKIGQDFLKEVDKFMKQKKIAEQKRNPNS